MSKKILFIFFIFCSVQSIGQKKRAAFFLAGKIEYEPNIQLYLDTNQTYELKMFTGGCFSWQFLNGKYNIRKDSLVLEYMKFHYEPSCRIIDTFKSKKTINFLYVNDSNKVYDTLTVELDNNHDTFNISYFPQNYIDTIIVKNHNQTITYTYYIPDFKGSSMNLRVYKPKRKLKETSFIPFKIENNNLIINEKYKGFISPFERLKKIR